jgi:hypothetical protein
MKTLKTIILGLALIAICGAAKATDNNDDMATPNHAINTYIDAMTRGKLQGLNDVLDKTAEFSLLRGKSVITADKKEMLEYFELNKNVEQTCTTSTSMIENNDNIAIVKVDMKYSDFVRSNYVTIARTGAGWKITSVYSTFK